MIRFAYFDAAGTLIKPHPSVGTVYARAGAPFGLSASAAELETAFRSVWPVYTQPALGGPMSAVADEASTRAWWRGLLHAVLSEVGFSGDRDRVFEACYRAFSSTEAWQIFDDVRPTLEGLRELGIPLGVLSNWDPRLAALLGELELAPYFQTLVVSAVEGVEKPDRRIFQIAQQRAGIAPSEILYVGDHDHLDVAPARALGFQAFLIDRPGTSGSPHAIRSLKELLPIAARDLVTPET